MGWAGRVVTITTGFHHMSLTALGDVHAGISIVLRHNCFKYTEAAVKL